MAQKGGLYLMVYPLPGGSFSCDFLVSPAARKSGKCISRLMPPHRTGGVRGAGGGGAGAPGRWGGVEELVSLTRECEMIQRTD